MRTKVILVPVNNTCNQVNVRTPIAYDYIMMIAVQRRVAATISLSQSPALGDLFTIDAMDTEIDRSILLDRLMSILADTKLMEAYKLTD